MKKKIIINKWVFAMLQTIKLLLHRYSFTLSHVHPIKDHQYIPKRDPSVLYLSIHEEIYFNVVPDNYIK